MQVQGQHKPTSLKGPVQGAPSQHTLSTQQDARALGRRRGPERAAHLLRSQSSTSGPRPRLPSPSATPELRPALPSLPGESKPRTGKTPGPGLPAAQGRPGCRRPWGALFLLLHPQARPSPRFLPNQALPTRASLPRGARGQSGGVCPQETSPSPFC